MVELYTGAQRRNLDDTSEILALEIAEGRVKPEESKDEIESLPEMQPEPAGAEEATYRKRYGDLRRHQEKLNVEIQNLRRQLEDATTKNVGMPTSEEEIEAWAKEYPDVARMVEALAERKARKVSSSLEDKVKIIEEREQHTRREAAELEIRKRHPDFDELRKDPAFHKWAEIQPSWVQHALYVDNDDAASCARAIDLYKLDTRKETEASKPKKSVKTDASMAVSTKSSTTTPEPNSGKRVWKESEIARMNRYEWDTHEEDVLLARHEGRILFGQ